MKRITLMRHGISIGNENKIIQGKEDFGLSEKGKIELNNQNFQNLENIKKIYSSDSTRAQETADIVRNKINYQSSIITDKDLRENSAGILDGKSKLYCSKNLSKEYEIYTKRGDYDEIPEADSWKENQARALSFLSRYINNDEYNDLIVSHAAFIRTFINLIEYRERNTQFNIPNGYIGSIDNPLSKLRMTNYPIAKSSTVDKIECYDNSYIIKRKNNQLNEQDYFEADLLNYLSQKINTPRILNMSNQPYGQVKVLEFIEGIHKFGELSESDTLKILKAVLNMHEHLSKYDAHNIQEGNIKQDLEKARKNLYTEDARLITEQLLKNEKFNNYLNESKKVLVHNDLHRSNILIDKDEAHILDFENIVKYPKDLQLATLLCSCFLLENMNYSTEKILNIWKSKVDKTIMNDLIDYRIIYGLAFFEEKIKSGNYDDNDINIRTKYVRALRRNK